MPRIIYLYKKSSSDANECITEQIMTAFNMKRMGKRVLWMGTKMVQVETGKYGWSVITVDGNTWFAGYNDFDFF